MAVHLAVAGDVFDGVSLCAVFFSQEMSGIRSGAGLSPFLTIFLPNFNSIFIPKKTPLLQHSNPSGVMAGLCCFNICNILSVLV